MGKPPGPEHRQAAGDAEHAQRRDERRQVEAA